MVRKRQRLFLSSGLVLLSLLLPWSIVQGRKPRPNLSSDDPELTLQQRGHIRQLRVDAPEGSSVTVTAASTLSDAVSYMSGEKFVVIIPQAVVTSMQSDVRGRGFLSMQIEQRGEDVAISFRLQTGATARIVQKLNSVEVAFTVPEVAIVGASTAGTKSRSVAAAVLPPTSTSSPTVMPDVSQPPQGGGIGAAGNLIGVLNSLFPGASKDVTADTSNIDLSIPESPAATVLGVTPSTVVRPASPREFASSLLNGLDQNGNFQTGLAIDTAPYLLFNGKEVTILDYNHQYATRLLSRTQFSLAATKGASSDDTSTRLGLGLNLTLWDNGDARIYHPERADPTTGEGDVLSCFVKQLQLAPDIPPLLGGASDEQRQRHAALVASINAQNKVANDKVADECRDKARKANWNKSSWVVAYAPSWISETGQTSSFKWNGGAFWTSLAYGFEGVPSLEKIGQLILHARYRTREQVPDPVNEGRFLTQNSMLFGARFRAGSPTFAFNLEDSLIRTTPLGGRASNSNRFSLGAEARLNDNLYFVISGGSNLGGDDGQQKGFLMTSFKYGFSKKSQFNPQPQ